MTDREFVQWLNGYLEVSGCQELGERETSIIKEKLQSVFKKETPTYISGGASGKSTDGNQLTFPTSMMAVNPSIIIGTC